MVSCLESKWNNVCNLSPDKSFLPSLFTSLSILRLKICVCVSSVSVLKYCKHCHVTDSVLVKWHGGSRLSTHGKYITIRTNKFLKALRPMRYKNDVAMLNSTLRLIRNIKVTFYELW